MKDLRRGGGGQQAGIARSLVNTGHAGDGQRPGTIPNGLAGLMHLLKSPDDEVAGAKLAWAVSRKKLSMSQQLGDFLAQPAGEGWIRIVDQRKQLASGGGG